MATQSTYEGLYKLKCFDASKVSSVFWPCFLNVAKRKHERTLLRTVKHSIEPVHLILWSK